MSRNVARLVAVLLAVWLAAWAGTAQACTVSTAGPADYGPFSPAAAKQAKVPVQTSPIGLRCQIPSVALLSNNKIVGTFQSQNNLKLVNGASSISYVASADPAQNVKFTQGGSIDYFQNNLLVVLGLLGNTTELPISIKPSGVTLPNGVTTLPVGVYTDKITMTWTYYVCSLNLAGACGGLRQGTGVVTTLDVKLTVEARAVTLAVSSATTWDPVNTTSNPKSLPEARKRLIADLTNTDPLVAVDPNAIGVNLAVPAGTIIALDGDNTATPAFVKVTDGTPASSLAITYTSPASTTDDVDFSSDHGVTWAYAPSAGNVASQAAVTNVRLRPRGAMAAGSKFSASVALKVN